ncbi:hypothetical protein EXIGLDRAFT_731007 [Exidia glandulosa HHB12029]|uniref:CRIB domain-containing protein n=1 Tax=Exidia glandulosa HHB12029 TaxID=1314781 RepID=A0A165Q0J1_EXIGL|nr:hypothetical protein EXIGLDRAFT_731007 [Exidia glandulosa HHB12029]
MLSLLCHSPRPDDYDYDPRRQPRRLSLSTAPRRKKRIEKLSIGNPTDFKHERHIGSDLVVPPNMVEADKWRREVHRHDPTPSAVPTRPQSHPPPLYATPAPALMPVRRASLPSDQHQYQPEQSPVSPVRRKAIPAYLDETASVSPFPTIVGPSSAKQKQQQPQPQQTKERELVRLLDTLPERPDARDPLLVTKTTKARFDNAMTEIAQALRDP